MMHLAQTKSYYRLFTGTNTAAHRLRPRQFSSSTKVHQQSQNHSQSNYNPFTGFLEWYTHRLSTHPLLTKSITGGLIAGGGDFVCQTVIEENDGNALKEWDPARTARFAFLGTFFVSPTNHVWYKFLAKRMAPGISIPQVLKRVAWDQFTWTPVYTAVWLSSLWCLEGTKPQEIKTTLQREYMGIMYANWYV